MKSDDMLQDLIEQILSHFTTTEDTDAGGNPLRIVEMRIDRKTTLFRAVEAKPSERETLAIAIILLQEYLKQPGLPIFKQRLASVAERNKTR